MEASGHRRSHVDAPRECPSRAQRNTNPNVKMALGHNPTRKLPYTPAGRGDHPPPPDPSPPAPPLPPSPSVPPPSAKIGALLAALLLGSGGTLLPPLLRRRSPPRPLNLPLRLLPLVLSWVTPVLRVLFPLSVTLIGLLLTF